jgi:hypothetical protein
VQPIKGFVYETVTIGESYGTRLLVAAPSQAEALSLPKLADLQRRGK